MKGRDEFHFAEPMKGALLYTFRRMVWCTDLHRTKATSYAGRRVVNPLPIHKGAFLKSIPITKSRPMIVTIGFA